MAYKKIPSLNWLRVFEAAAQTESFSAAASILNMSPSAVSQQISALEHHLDKKLFLRKAKSVSLTENGYLFLPTVREALSSIETNAAMLFGLDRDQQLSVSATTIFATSWLAPRITEFQALYPEVSLSITCDEQALNAIHSPADIVISFESSAWTGDEATALFSETLYPVALPHVASTIQHLSDLNQHRLIDVAGHRQSWRLILGGTGDAGENQRPYSVVSNTNLAFCMAASGGGIALARTPATDWLAEQHGLTTCLPDMQIRGEGSYFLTVRPSRQRRDIATAFRDWIMEEVRQYKN